MPPRSRRTRATCSKKGAQQPDPAWEEFQARHDDHPALLQDTLYALPVDLISAIQDSPRRARRPAFFESEDLRFERNLAALGGNGFFRKCRFEYPLLPIRSQFAQDSVGQELDAQGHAQQQQIRDLMTREMAALGRRDSEIDAYFGSQQSLEEVVRERQVAYAGWLVTNPSFQSAVCQFRANWESRVDRDGYLPRLPWTLMGGPSKVAKRDHSYVMDYTMFYRSWALDRLATWHLPVPMRPQLATPNLYHADHTEQAGVTLSIPWYMLRDKKLTLHDLVSINSRYNLPKHLDEWVSGQPKDWGFKRFGMMLQLFMWLELALRPRYPERMTTNRELLDHAFAAYLVKNSDEQHDSLRMAENVRKVRQKLYRRLKGA